MRFTLALAATVSAAVSVGAVSLADIAELETRSSGLGHFELSRDLNVLGDNSTIFEARSVTHEDGEWFDVGLMMARGEEPNAGLVERDQVEPRGAVEHWDNFPLARDLDGGYKFPNSYAEAKRMLRAAGKVVRRKVMPGSVRVTWYSGADLRGPSCGDWRLGGKWHPTDRTYNAAVTASWSGKEKPTCKSLIRLTTPKGRRVVVRVVDSCAGSAMSPSNSCTKGMKVVDLTRAAFKALAPLDQGIIDKVKVETIHLKKGYKWTKKDTARWGPLKF